MCSFSKLFFCIVCILLQKVDVVVGQKSICPGGIPHYTGKVCCPSSCGICGGSRCGSRQGPLPKSCCVSAIKATQRFCGKHPPPCRFLPDSLPEPPPVPKVLGPWSSDPDAPRVLMLHTGWEEISVNRYISAFNELGAASYKAVGVDGIKNVKDLAAWDPSCAKSDPTRMHTCTHQHLELWPIANAQICLDAKATIMEVRRQVCLLVQQHRI
mmetsp:Transcript_36488/g.79530  ORF Transcript_36488/g.79530 Transcript_36488/m.79530 type:complete len:212 (-) Transcript_36488:271-906(-)